MKLEKTLQIIKERTRKTPESSISRPAFYKAKNSFLDYKGHTVAFTVSAETSVDKDGNVDWNVGNVEGVLVLPIDKKELPLSKLHKKIDVFESIEYYKSTDYIGSAKLRERIVDVLGRGKFFKTITSAINYIDKVKK